MTVNLAILAKAHPREVRAAIREGQWDKPSGGLAQGYVQANLVILPEYLAYDFLLFCQRNPRPCPLLETTEPGVSQSSMIAENADLQTDLSRYRVFRNGELVEEVSDIREYWRSDLVCFLIGCTNTFEGALVAANIRLRHIEEQSNPPVFVTNIACESAGAFTGPMVVSMLPILSRQVADVVRISGRYPKAHGAPIHIGNPQAIGIDLDKPDFGELMSLKIDEVPVFWACGVTPQIVARNAHPDIMITHAPGHTLVADWPDNTLDEA